MYSVIVFFCSDIMFVYKIHDRNSWIINSTAVSFYLSFVSCPVGSAEYCTTRKYIQSYCIQTCALHTHTHIHTCLHIHTYIHTYIHRHRHTHTHIHTYIHTCIHIHIHTNTHIHTYIHTYIHTSCFVVQLKALIITKCWLTWRWNTFWRVSLALSSFNLR